MRKVTFTESHGMGTRWWNCFFQLINLHDIKDVAQAKIHKAETLVPEPSASVFELAIEKLKSRKTTDIGQIPEELIKVGGRKICLEIHKLITSNWKKEKLPEEWKE